MKLKILRYHIRKEIVSYYTILLIAAMLMTVYSSGINAQSVDIGIFKLSCNNFEVKLRPDANINSDLTNLQFTLKWPENTVGLINFTSTFGLAQQGPVFTSDGFNYAVFVSVPTAAMPINWLAGEEYTVMTFEHDQTGMGAVDILIAQDTWATQNNGLYYVELLGTDHTGLVYHEALNCYTGLCIDIGVFNTGCATFELRLHPGANVSSELTNLQFTLKWPENTVGLINFTSTFGLAQQGPVFTSGGFNYAVFVSVPTAAMPINWLAGEEYVVMSFEHDQTGTGTVDILIAQDTWATQNNGLYYVELWGTDYTGIVYHEALNVSAGPCCTAYVDMFLQGAYVESSGMMRTDINAAGDLPLSQPYNTPPWNYAGTETVVSFPDSIVDWVLIELRDQNDPSILIERRAALLSKSGLALDTDFTEGVSFLSPTGDYYLVVDHRNHMPAMSGNTVTLPNNANPYDFREIINTQPYLHNNPLPTVLELPPAGSGKYGIIAGDVNADKVLKYSGLNNDRGLIINQIFIVSGSTLLTATINGYYAEDITLDDIVKYSGSENDRAIIISNLGTLTGSFLLTVTYTSVVP